MDGDFSGFAESSHSGGLLKHKDAPADSDWGGRNPSLVCDSNGSKERARGARVPRTRFFKWSAHPTF